MISMPLLITILIILKSSKVRRNAIKNTELRPKGIIRFAAIYFVIILNIYLLYRI